MAETVLHSWSGIHRRTASGAPQPINGLGPSSPTCGPLYDLVVPTAQPPTTMRRPHGFTLIELMIVLAIIGIILAIAVPSFREQIAKSRRSEAMSALQDMQLKQESYRSTRPTYATQAQYVATFGGLPGSDYYTFTIPASTATSYTLTATPAGGQAGDRCGNLSLQYAAGVTSQVSSTGATKCWD